MGKAQLRGQDEYQGGGWEERTGEARKGGGQVEAGGVMGEVLGEGVEVNWHC